MIENYSALPYVCMKKSTHRGFRGPNNCLLARRTFRKELERRFFDAESTDADASFARKRSKMSPRRVPPLFLCHFSLFLSSLLPLLFLPLFLPSSLTTFRKDAPIMRENRVIFLFLDQIV